MIAIAADARDNDQRFVFRIEQFLRLGFQLLIFYRENGRRRRTALGVWPTIEQAQQAAQETAAELVPGSVVSWDDDPR